MLFLKKYKVLINILAYLFLYSFFYSQITATSHINRNEIRIGEPIDFNLTLSIPKELKDSVFIWPSFKDTITSKIEIIDFQKVDTFITQNTVEIQQKLRISVYDSGQFILPSIRFSLKKDTSKFVSTNTLLIIVHTVPTDTSETSVKDIKPIFEEPFDIRWYFPVILKGLIVLLILAAIISGIYWYYKKKNSPQDITKPKLPPHIVALQKLEQIQKEAIWKRGEIKAYYSAVADTIREYIEGRFAIPALEQTSHETLQALKYKAIAPSTREKIQYLFELSDLVKFAKLLPVENDHIQILQSAFDFVNDTRPDFTSKNNTSNQHENSSNTNSTS